MKGWSDLTDEELMLRYQRGDEKAFELLYQRHSAKVYGFLMSHLKDRGAADDVFQGTFMKLHRTRDRYDATCAFAPWLFTICRSVMLDALRKKKRVREDLDPLAVEQAVAPVAEAAGAVAELGSLGALPPPQRQAIELRYGEDLSFEEIAKRLETSPMNARQLVSRAVRKLRTLTGGHHE